MAVVPAVVKTLLKQGFKAVAVESGAGAEAGFSVSSKGGRGRRRRDEGGMSEGKMSERGSELGIERVKVN